MAGPEKQVVTTPPVVAPQQPAAPFFAGNQPATPATDTDKKQFVLDAIDYLKSAGDFYGSVILTADKFEELFTKTLSVYNAQETIATELKDDALLTSLRAAFTGAVRSLFMRGAAQLKIPLIRLYLQNMYRIPAWAWPDSSAFTFTKDEDRKKFIEDTTAALNDVALFSGYTKIDEASLKDILTRLKELVANQELMIKNSFKGDATMLDALRAAYKGTVNRLLTKAAADTGKAMDILYLQSQYVDGLIPDWMDQHLAGTSTPLPMSAMATGTAGEVSFVIDGITVIIAPDLSDSAKGVDTNIDITAPAGSVSGKAHKVTKFSIPAPTLRIHTHFGVKEGNQFTAATKSGYGRGTTEEDKANKNTSLGFHEGNHGRDFLRYIMTHPFPKFSGTVGMPVNDFKTQASDYATAWTKYKADMERGSQLNTDCVGFTIEEYYADKPAEKNKVKCK